MKKQARWAILLSIAALFAGCSSAPPKITRTTLPPPRSVDLSQIPDAEPKPEPPARYGNPSDYEVFGKRYTVLKSSKGYQEQGVASWYGPGFQEKLTSTREPYDMYAMTAAHKTLPLPTYAQVTNVRNGRRVIVRINDRGPFVDDRIIDLSYVAAVKLGLDGPGTGEVEVYAIDPIEWARNKGSVPNNLAAVPQGVASPPPAAARPAPRYRPAEVKPIYIQVGTFSSLKHAHQLRDRLRLPNVAARVQSNGGLHKVQIGPLASLGQADDVYRQVTRYGVPQAYYVSQDGALLRR